jgi:urease accessory protein
MITAMITPLMIMRIKIMTISTITAMTMSMTTRTAMPAAAGMTITSALPLFAWLSPAFPVGAYAYSHGLEWAVEDGDIKDEASLLAWLQDTLTLGAGRNDAILLAHAYRAFGDEAAFTSVNDLALALAPSQELRLETAQQGRSFLDAVLAAWRTDELADAAKTVGEIAYPVAVGLAAAAHKIPLNIALPAFILAFAQNLVSAAIRSAPIGQTSGQRVIHALTPVVEHIATEAETLTLDDIGGSVFRADLGSFKHETQYTRLFRS